MSNSNANSNNEGFADKFSQQVSSCCAMTGLCCFKMKENTNITILNQKITNRKKTFGVDYLTLIGNKAAQPQLKTCVKEALADISKLQTEMNEHYDNIDHKQAEVDSKIRGEAPQETNDSTSPDPRKQRPVENIVSEVEDVDDEDEGASSSKKKDTKKPSKRPSKPVASKGKSSKTMKSSLPVPEEYQNADPSKWKLSKKQFSGSVTYATRGKEEKVKGKSIQDALELFKANPGTYTALMYQTSMVTENWSSDQHQYTLVHREGTNGYQPQGVSPKGWMTMLLNDYEALPPFKDNILSTQHRDKYTDNMTHQRYKLHSKKNVPILPGRGMGVCDAPNIKIIGDVDPSDIHQGSVGDCWLLSGISSLAEFDGAVKRLFRKTKNLDKRPLPGPNTYTITLWDLPTWTEVDILIDERLAVMADGSRNILASKPSEDGELWVCYLEKALAAHCGGWDKITGGQCTHAWALLTGCKEQYTIGKNKNTGKYRCHARFDPMQKKWAPHTNSPHDSDGNNWQCAWPKVGGGGGAKKEIDEKELFLKMAAWDKENYIVGAGTSGSSDKDKTDGLVDNHAYSVIQAINDVAGTDIDLLQVRNPWGKGEIEDGEFDDDGPGWDKYPQIKKELKPVVADDGKRLDCEFEYVLFLSLYSSMWLAIIKGIFWVTKKEFFKYFQTVYVSASNMTEFLED